MNHRAVINVGVGSWYPRGHDRLKQSLIDVGFQGRFFGWRNEFPPGSPTHEECPDAFKSYAFQHAIREGCTTILWLDCSVWAMNPVEPLFDIIEGQGYYFLDGGCGYVGNWCKDSALPTLRLTREQAMLIPNLYGLLMGIDYTWTANPNSKGWLDEFNYISQDGVTLPGPHPKARQPVFDGGANLIEHGEISDDPRVFGHAHEQTVASALAYHYDMKLRPYELIDIIDSGGVIRDPSKLLGAGGM